MNSNIAEELICPITLNLLEDPITVPCCGRSYSRQSLIQCFDLNIRLCPTCRKNLVDFNPRTAPKNIAISHIIDIIKNNQFDNINHQINNNFENTSEIIGINSAPLSIFANINNIIQNEHNREIINDLIDDSHKILKSKTKDRPIAHAITNFGFNILKNLKKKIKKINLYHSSILSSFGT
jgi:hypothetical protein